VSLQDELRTLFEDVFRKVLREELRAQTPAETDDPFLSVADAAELASLTPGTIRAWIKLGQLHRYGRGRLLRVRRSELLALLAGADGKPPAAEDVSPEALARRDHERDRDRRTGRDRRTNGARPK
jgi:excisionase family DNA binding protein